MHKERVSFMGNTRVYEIEEVESFVAKVKEKGATHIEIYYTNDMGTVYTRLEGYKYLTDEEIEQKEIDRLEKRLKELKGE